MRWAQRAIPSFLCLPKEKKAKERAPPRLGLRYASTPLRVSVKTGAAELAPFGRSDSPRFSRFCPAVLGCTKGTGHSVARSVHPCPVDAAEHRSRFREQVRACLSGRSPRVHARRKRREAQGTPCFSKGQVVGGPFLCLLSFGQAKERRASVRRRARQKPIRASARPKPTHEITKVKNQRFLGGIRSVIEPSAISAAKQTVSFRVGCG